jgi:DNA-binding NarL/FixJ family response regulator
MSINVVLVDDHAVVRDGLRALLESQADLSVAASFGDADTAVRYCIEAHPDVVVLDIALPGLGGIAAAKLIHDQCAAAKILMLSMHSGAEYVHQALRAGANGYVLKESAGAEVIEAVRTVHNGGRFLSRKLSPQALDAYTSERGPEAPLARLSARERQVLKLVVEGKTSGEIAALLGLSPKSIDTYRSRMMLKLGIEDVPSLVKFAIRHGITSVE